MMKFRQILLSIFLCLVASSCAPNVPQKRPLTGLLVEYQGKWLIINYWATWCGPCRIEVPDLNAFYKMYKDKNVVVLGVNYDHEPEEKLQASIAKLNIQFPVLRYDPADQLGLSRPSGIPTSYIIAPDGTIVDTLRGNQTLEKLQAALAKAQQNAN